jgi:hypothetical protein
VIGSGRTDLACWLCQAGRVKEAVTQFQQLLTDRTRVLGPDHSETVITRNNLAYWLHKSGRVTRA